MTRIDFADTDTALVTLQAMASTFYEAIGREDVEATKAMYGILSDATAGIIRLVRRFGNGSRRPSPGDSFPPLNWKDMAPEDILRNLANMIMIDEIEIELKRAKARGSRTADARKLSQQISRLTRILRAKVISARAYIKKHWPDYWTDKQESDFRGWL